MPHVTGLVQIDAVLLNQASVDEVDPGSGEALNENRFVLRRARLQADMRYGVWSGYVSLEANSMSAPPLRVHGAEAMVRYPAESDTPWFLASAGLFLVPFSFSVLERDNLRLYFEPPQWVNALFPGRRDLGVRLEGQYRFLHVTLAVMNGEPSAAAFPVHDPNAAKDVLGRLSIAGSLGDAVHVSAGTALLLGSGFHRGRAQTKDMLVWRDVNEDGVAQPTEIQAIGAAAAEASRNFARFGIGGDVQLDARVPVLGALRAFAEIVYAKNLDRGLWPADPVASGRQLRELGYAFGLSQRLTRHAELGVRYDYYNPDFDATDRQGALLVPENARYATWTITGAWLSFEPGRLVLEYNHRQNALGRDESGLPTTLASDSFAVRAQLAF